MDLVVKGRNGRVPEPVKRLAEQKLSKLARIDPRVTRVELELREERNPRVDGHYRVKAACRTHRGIFRAAGKGEDTAHALDQLVYRLDRQLTSNRGRFRAQLVAGASRVKFGRPGTGPEGLDLAD